MNGDCECERCRRVQPASYARRVKFKLLHLKNQSFFPMHQGSYLAEAALGKNSAQARKLLTFFFARMTLDDATQSADRLPPRAPLHQASLDFKEKHLHLSMLFVQVLRGVMPFCFVLQ